MFGVGRNVLGLGAIALGLVGLVWGDFASVWQPVPDALPGRKALAYGLAAAFLIAGLAVQWRRSARWGTLGLIGLFGVIVGLMHAPRVIAHPYVFIAWSGLAEQLGTLAGAVAVLSLDAGASATRLSRLARLAFGLSLISFAAAHFVYLKETAAVVPTWLPNPTAWAWATGAAHLAAAVAILSDVLALLAARLLTLMFVGFGLLVHLPSVIHDPTSHMNWAANAVNLSLIGAAWAIADVFAKARRPPARSKA